MIEVSTPGVWYPGQTEEELEEEIELMLLRSKATNAFVTGQVDADFFLNFLHESGVDIFSAAEEWNLGDGIIT
jgi:hypothetical protein